MGKREKEEPRNPKTVMTAIFGMKANRTVCTKKCYLRIIITQYLVGEKIKQRYIHVQKIVKGENTFFTQKQETRLVFVSSTKDF